MSEAFARLHPAVAHHVVNSLGWRGLRPLQEQAIGPVMDGSHALLSAPTAQGKTEAAVLPLLSRVLEENWGGLSVLYLCPLRALLNNLHPRVDGLCELVGRRAGLWHGDVGDAGRRRLLEDPPDFLLTTPESLEAMFLSRRVDERALLRGVRAVVVDEIHAFAGDDRGWHLLAMLARLDALAGRELQRVGLTATVGNPEELLEWLTTGTRGPRMVLRAEGTLAVPELEVDYVGTVANAARVIASLHRGEKRLVFADSRARVEELATALRGEGVTTFVSHSSLSPDERRQAERAFGEARDCVIVATSTLELGIDVGDLDRVIQLGAPRTVASVLQRMGRTGRRGGARRNCLFLATSDAELLQALALIELVGRGWVEPLVAPAWPIHLAAQQLLARVLAEGRLGRSVWPGVFATVGARAGLGAGEVAAVLEHMVACEMLVEDAGLVQVGPAGEREFGRRHFMEVTSLFLTEPLFAVRWGRRDLGQVDPSSLTAREGRRPVILMGGHAWGVGEIDWSRRIAWVQPVDEPGRSRWIGPGGALSMEVCHAMRRVLAARDAPAEVSRRAAGKLDEVQERLWFAQDGETSLVYDAARDRTRWWTWAGGRANAALGAVLEEEAGLAAEVTTRDDLGLTLNGAVGAQAIVAALRGLEPATASEPVDPRRLEGVKFAAALPPTLVAEMLRRRGRDPEALARVASEPVVVVPEAG